jgi:hypothetical protein
VGAVPKTSIPLIMLAWIPAGLIGLFIAGKLPINVRLPFLALVIIGVIYYRAVGAAKLRKKLMADSKH